MLLGESGTMTVSVTISSVFSLSISDETDMMPVSAEIAKRPSALVAGGRR